MNRAKNFVISAGIILALLMNQAAAQSQPVPQKPDSSPTIGAEQPVISVQGLCGDHPNAAQKNSPPCSRTITREQFERLMNALNPGAQPVPPGGRQNLGQTYAEYLAFEAAAAKTGMLDTPQFHEIMDWVRLRTIAEVYRRNLQEKFRTPSPEEIDAYYHQHPGTFERVRLTRIFVPRANPSGARDPEFDQKALKAAQAARQRAALGEDPDEIQKQTYSTLGLEAPPATALGAWRRADFIPKEGDEVFSLKPGEVSQVETEIQSYVIYKVTAKETLPQEQVKAEIIREISQQKYTDAIKAVIESVHAEFSEPYFGPGTALKLPPPAPRVPTAPPPH